IWLSVSILSFLYFLAVFSSVAYKILNLRSPLYIHSALYLVTGRTYPLHLSEIIFRESENFLLSKMDIFYNERSLILECFMKHLRFVILSFVFLTACHDTDAMYPEVNEQYEGRYESLNADG